MKHSFEIELLFLQKVSEGGFDEICIMYGLKNDDFSKMFYVQSKICFFDLGFFQWCCRLPP